MQISVTKIFIVTIVCLLLAGTCQGVTPHPGKLEYDVPQTYEVNWDVAPYQRWYNLAKIYKPSLQSFVNHIESMIKLPYLVQKVVELYANNIYKYQDYVQEMQGVADAAEIPFSYVFLANFAYEMSVACSGILIRNSQGVILHGRNLDFPFYDYLSKLSAKVKIIKGGQWVATWDHLIGYVFVLTGQREDQFAINVDTRMEPQEITQVFYNVFVRQYLPSCGLVREVLISGNQTNFTQAYQALKETPISGPIYYIISGRKGNEGAVIEREPTSVNNFYELSNQTWFLVQTNYDRDVIDRDGRRTAAEQRIKDIGNKITPQQLFDNVLTLFPTLNSHTLYTSVMINSIQYNNLTSWYGINNPQ